MRPPREGRIITGHELEKQDVYRCSANSRPLLTCTYIQMGSSEKKQIADRIIVVCSVQLVQRVGYDVTRYNFNTDMIKLAPVG